MFFIMPIFAVVAVYIVIAIVPAIFLMRYIYRKDTVEKEPPACFLPLCCAEWARRWCR